MQNDNPFMPPAKKKLAILPILLGIGLLIAMIFGAWSFMAMMDYKTNSDKKSKAAVDSALAQQKKTLDADYAEKSKSPYDSYQASSEFGSMLFSYPKTWELYVDAKISGGASSIDGYAHPNFVPGINSDTSYALRFQVVDRQYAEEVKTFNSNIKAGSVSLAPFRLDKVADVAGSKVTGQIIAKKTGVMYLFPLRDKTLKIWTESANYIPDLDIVVKDLSYNP